MISKHLYEETKSKVLAMFHDAGIAITEEEKQRIEVADFDLNDLSNVGLQILVYVNTTRVCAKEMVLFPYQTCPEHRHIDNPLSQGKEETFRVRKGTCYLYVEGESTKPIKAKLPNTPVTVFKEIELNAGEQYTLMPNTLHWFQAGDKGAIISEFSTMSTDEFDVFTDKRIKRIPKIGD